MSENMNDRVQNATTVNEVKGYTPVKIKGGRAADRGERNVLTVIGTILGFFYSTDVKGFNLLHAILYAYRFLRIVRGGPRTKADERERQHDSREGRVHGTGGYGRDVDFNTVCDLVQSAFLIFFLSKRGKKGEKPENLDTATACGRAVDRWYRTEKRIQLSQDRKVLAESIKEVKESIDDLFSRELLWKEANNQQLKSIVDGLMDGKSQKDIADEMGVTKQYIGKLLRTVKLARRLDIMREKDRASEQRPTVSSRSINPLTGKWILSPPSTLPTDDVPIRHDDTFIFSGTLPASRDTVIGPVALPMDQSHLIGPILPSPVPAPVKMIDPVKLQSRYFWYGCPQFVPLTYDDGSVSVNHQWDGMPNMADGEGI